MARALWPYRRWPGRALLAQVLVAQGVLVVVWLCRHAPVLIFAGICLLGLAILVATFGRSDGQWFAAHLWRRVRYVRRRRRAAVEVLAGELGRAHADPLDARLRSLAPGLVLTSVGDVGVGLDEGGWFAAVEAGAGAGLPLAEVAARVGWSRSDAVDTGLSAVQVVVPGGPAPTGAWVAVR
ncbi:hypothetical protein, partial [Luedemannella flava]|uniref:hypothetical protein n=1 Tax=Luedemannella flava TaxID=349316 RepID=UPI003CD0B6CF